MHCNWFGIKLFAFVKAIRVGISAYVIATLLCVPIVLASGESLYTYGGAITSIQSEPFWGDTHVHTNLSIDAFNYGNRSLGPEEAYRFAMGEVVSSSSGKLAKLRRPLDFLVVADHASNMGVMNNLHMSVKSKFGPLSMKWRKALDRLSREEISLEDSVAITNGIAKEGFLDAEVAGVQLKKSIWLKNIEVAEKFNNPGVFTTLMGFEWTNIFFNLHRVVIFGDDIDRVGQTVPFSQYDSSDPEELWAYLEDYVTSTGGDALAIPHNSNLSQGVMFATETAKGKPFSTDYSARRVRWEPLVEVTQIKGDSETHPTLSPKDEFSNYEKFSSFAGNRYRYESVKRSRGISDYDSWIRKNEDVNDGDWMRTYEYVRSALKLGLQEKNRIGINPFQFGMIGSTDSHTSLSTADENNFWGKLADAEPHENRLMGPWRPGQKLTKYGWEMSSAGYAAVWAEENTRKSLFAAMKRKEVYASTGPRIRVRFFGGWNYDVKDAYKPNLPEIGYMKGVPMGGELANAPEGKSPTFLIQAVRDPIGANLDRIQVVKGWYSKAGKLNEKIYNVAFSGGRYESKSGRMQAVGNTVDVEMAEYTNTIGDAELAVVWRDPDFESSEFSFYYARVLEIPTPRWTAYDAKNFGLRDIPKEVPMTTQERAYTSPIWYSPE